jgi:hypothetical protein
MFSVITNIYNNDSCSQPQENWIFFFDTWRCSMCAPRVTRHTSTRYSSFSHTSVNMGQHGHYIHSHRLAAEMWTTMKNNLLGKNCCPFYLYRFRKYVSYGFPIINFCNPGVHYETPCITALSMTQSHSPISLLCYFINLSIVLYSNAAVLYSNAAVIRRFQWLISPEG